MAVYKHAYGPSDWSLKPLKLVEHHVYGSSRLGIVRRDVDVTSILNPKKTPVVEDLIGNTYVYTAERGWKLYELTNHLGNVLVTVTDKKIGVPSSGNSSLIDHYTADVVSASDYYPFGMLMPGRKFESGEYRYGFNGKENDNEVKGEGSQQDYGMKVYDPRLGRFLSLDPLEKKFPYWSPYHFSGDNPIRFIDLDGAEILDPFVKWFMTDAAVTITQNPTSAKAKAYAVFLGAAVAVQGAAEGVAHAVSHPKQAAKGLWRMITNTPEQNIIDYGMRVMEGVGDLPEPLKDYAVGGFILTDVGMAIAPFKGPVKSTGLKLSAELPAGTKVAGISFSRMGSNLVKKASEFKLTHSIETITKSAD